MIDPIAARPISWTKQPSLRPRNEYLVERTIEAHGVLKRGNELESAPRILTNTALWASRVTSECWVDQRTVAPHGMGRPHPFSWRSRADHVEPTESRLESRERLR